MWHNHKEETFVRVPNSRRMPPMQWATIYAHLLALKVGLGQILKVILYIDNKALYFHMYVLCAYTE